MILRFADCEIDCAARRLVRGGIEVAVEPRVLDLLVHLARSGPRVVPVEELHREVWEGAVVSPAAVRTAVKAARRAVGDDGARQAVIETVRGRGLRMAVEVEVLGGGDSPSRDPFVGRREILAVLETELRAVSPGGSRLVVIEGEPGSGKSRLLEVFSSWAEEAGVRVLRGPAAGPAAPALAPWRRILGGLLSGPDPPAVEAPDAELLRRSMPELSAWLPTGGSPQPPPDPREARFRLLELSTRLLAEASRRAPVLVVLDDLQDMDGASLELLDGVHRNGTRARMLFVGVSRPPEWAAGKPALAERGGLLRAPRRRWVALPGLAPEEVNALLRLLTGREAGSEELDALMRRTAGNPLFLRELALVPGALGPRAGPLPETIRHAVLHHLDTLAPSLRDLLATASLLGDPFEAPLLAAAATRPVGEVAGDLARAVAAGVLRPAAPGPARFSFVHALLAEALADALPATDRAARHTAIAAALAAQPDALREVGSIARHLLRAGPAVEPDRVVEACRGAAAAAVAHYAHDEALELLEAAEGVAAGAALAEEDRDAIALERAEALALLGRREEARAACRVVAGRARARGDGKTLARAALLFAGEQGDARSEPEVTALLEDALRILGAEAGALGCRLLARLAESFYYTPSLERGARLAGRAVARARSLGDPAALAHALRAHHWYTWAPDNLEAREEGAAELLDLAVRLGNVELEHVARVSRIAASLERGDREGLLDEVEAYRSFARRGRRLLLEWHEAHYRVLVHLLAGTVDRAEAALAEARALGQRAGYALSVNWYAVQLYGVRRAQGRLDELEPAMRELASAYPDAPWSLAWAAQRARTGDAGAASRHVEPLRHGGVRRLRRDFTFTTKLWFAADLARALMDAELAAAVEPELLRIAGRHVQVATGMLYLGPVARALAWAAEARGDRDAARLHGEQAAREDLTPGRAGSRA